MSRVALCAAGLLAACAGNVNLPDAGPDAGYSGDCRPDPGCAGTVRDYSPPPFHRPAFHGTLDAVLAPPGGGSDVGAKLELTF